MGHGLLRLIGGGVQQGRGHEFVMLGHVGLQNLMMVMRLLRSPVGRGRRIEGNQAQRQSIVQHVCAGTLSGHRLEASLVGLLPGAVVGGLLIQDTLQILKLLICH